MSDSIVEERHKKHVCQRCSFVYPRACLNGHALCAQIVEDRLEDTFGKSSRLSEMVKLHSLLTRCQSTEDTTILPNACGDKWERLGVRQQLQGVTMLHSGHSRRTPDAA